MWALLKALFEKDIYLNAIPKEFIEIDKVSIKLYKGRYAYLWIGRIEATRFSLFFSDVKQGLYDLICNPSQLR